MKYAVSIAGVIIIFIACRKKENNEPETVACPVINSYAVPALIVDSFSMRYPLDNVITWFRKDSIGYCAYFVDTTGKQILAQFGNDGGFVLQEIDLNHDGNFEDSTGQPIKGAEGCECMIPE